MAAPNVRRFAGPSVNNANYHNDNWALFFDGNAQHDVAHTTLGSAVAYMGSSDNKTLYVSETHRITASMTITANISPEFLKGGLLDLDSGVTVTMPVPKAGRYKIFTGSGTVSFSDEGTVFPEWWGAVGDNSTNSTTAIQKAMNTGNPILGETGGLYVTSSSLVLAASTALSIHSLKLRPNAAFTCLTDSGSANVSTTMTGAHRVNALSFTVTSSSGMAVGDLIELKSDQNWPFNHESGTIKKGELTKIAGISGTTITPTIPLLCDYDTASETVTVNTYTPNVVNIDGLEIIYNPARSAIGVGLDFLDGATSSLRNIKVEGATLTGISLQQCYGVGVENPKLVSCYESGFGYGIQLNGCTGIQINGGYSYRARHGADFSGGYPSHYCSVRHMYIEGHRDEGSCLSTHGGANRSIFSDNTLIGGPIGVQIRSPNTIVHNNVFGGHTSGFIFLGGAPGISVRGNVQFLRHAGTTISANDGYFMEVGLGTNAGATEDNTLYGFSTTEFVVEDNLAFPLVDFILFGSSITKLEYWSIKNNVAVIANNSGGTNIAFLEGTSAATINSTSVYGPNHVRNINGTYTELRNITLNGAGSGGNTQQTFSVAPIMSALTASLPVFTDANKSLVSNAKTGTGSVVMSADAICTGTWTLQNADFSGALTGATIDMSSFVKGSAVSAKNGFFHFDNASGNNLVGLSSSTIEFYIGGTLAFSFTTTRGTFPGHLIRSVETGITASTTQTQGQGPLTKDFNYVTTVANTNDTVTLPSAVAGMQIKVRNQGANTMQIFPASGDAIDGAAVDASVTLTAGASVVFDAQDTTNWRT